MKRGFTLLELIVVIVIIGILATLGFAQYTRMIERSRGAEARNVLGVIRTQAAALWVERSTGTPATVPAGTFTNANVGIGNQAGQISDACSAAVPSTSFYFMYVIAQNAGNNGFIATATRCTGTNGKQPGGTIASTLILTSDLAAGTDAWSGTGGY
jgi:type IV pilus assembly protein PilE